MKSQTGSSTIKVNVPLGLKANVSKESNRIGISIQDFIRMLLSAYFAKSSSIAAIKRDEKLLAKARKELTDGQYIEISSTEELESHLMKE